MIFAALLVGWIVIALWLQPPLYVTFVVGFCLGIVAGSIDEALSRRRG